MGLTEKTTLLKIEIIEPYKLIQYIEKHEVLRDGVVIATTNNPKGFSPDQDISSAPVEVQTIAGAVWNQDIKDTYLDCLLSTQVDQSL